MSAQTTKEIWDIDRFRPSEDSIEFERGRLMMDWFLWSVTTHATDARRMAREETKAELADWVAEETQRRIDADTIDNFKGGEI